MPFISIIGLLIVFIGKLRISLYLGFLSVYEIPVVWFVALAVFLERDEKIRGELVCC